MKNTQCLGGSSWPVNAWNDCSWKFGGLLEPFFPYLGLTLCLIGFRNFLFVWYPYILVCPGIVPSWLMVDRASRPSLGSKRKAESPTKVQDSFRVEWMVLPVRWNLQARRIPRFDKAGWLWYMLGRSMELHAWFFTLINIPNPEKFNKLACLRPKRTTFQVHFTQTRADLTHVAV